ncbi:MAG: 7-carboxy-7-deazaguanine synthase [Methylococcales bacterium]|nr:7-carboxy-7-deazaguanine synthase [Methylococcales bacterium]
MSYAVKEMFYTLQGEGAHSGRPAVFVRFAGCNLWSGRERDRASAQCSFCDTDFVGTDGEKGGVYEHADALADAVCALWPGAYRPIFVVLTGGEPLLQVDAPLTLALHQRGCYIAVESNGTESVPDGIDWLCISPKGRAPVVVSACDELKLVYPQSNALPERFEHIKAGRYYLSPMAAPNAALIALPALDAPTQAAMRYCLQHPRWQLTLQSHKLLDMA